jgi:hypothetical protein
MIVDILDRHDPRQFGLSGLFTRGARALTKRSEPGEQAAAVDKTDVQIAEAHHMVAEHSPAWIMVGIWPALSLKRFEKARVSSFMSR